MELLLWGSVGFALGGLMVGLWQQGRLKALQMQLQQQQALSEQQNSAMQQQFASQLESAQADREEKQAQLSQLQAQLETARQHLPELSQQVSQLNERSVQLQRQLEEQAQAHQQRLQQETERFEQVQQRLQQTQQTLTEVSNENTQLKTEKAANEAHFAEQLAQIESQRTQLKKEFENLANEILEKKSQSFKQVNQESLTQLLTPVQKEMAHFKQRMEAIHTQELQQRAELKTELTHLQQLNQEITTQAQALTNALKGQKKTQGNWGELMLENVLESSGLRRGEDYEREVSFTNEEGSRQRPDAIVYLPQNKHIIIDAKTSLVAYTQYVNAENELEAQQALQAHVQAVADRIEELSDRHYYQLDELNSPEVVIMFMPIESAYIEALKVRPDLYQKAIEKQVLVTTPTTLLTSLNMVRQLWQFEEQNKHTAELAKRAEKFYNKLESFLSSMQMVGKQLDRAKESYEKAFGQLYGGRGNLIKQAAEFKELGVAVKKELPADLVEKSQLELTAAEKGLEKLD